MMAPTQDKLQEMIGCIRPAIRNERPYLVSGGAEVPPVKLNQNESPFDLPDDVKRDVVDRFMEIPANRYPREQPWELRDRLAESLGVAPDAILIGNGSNELTHTLGLAFVASGAPVVVPRPMFSLYESVIRMHEGRVEAVPARPDLRFDTEALIAARRHEQPPLTIITTPNNPTGLALSIADVEAIVEAAPGAVVVDEAYWEFNREAPATVLLERYPNLIIVRTFSKAMGLAGLRLGYLIAHPAVVAELMKSRLPFMVDRFAEAVGLAVLQHPELVSERVREILAGLEELRQELNGLEGVEALPSAANFFLFKTPEEPAKVLNRLASAGVLVRSMGGYPELASYLRVNAGTRVENKAFLAALKQALR